MGPTFKEECSTKWDSGRKKLIQRRTHTQIWAHLMPVSITCLTKEVKEDKLSGLNYSKIGHPHFFSDSKHEFYQDKLPLPTRVCDFDLNFQILDTHEKLKIYENFMYPDAKYSVINK